MRRACRQTTAKPDSDSPSTGRSPRRLSLVQKSALLNLGLVTTALPVLSFAASPKAAPIVLEILVVISVFIWALTFIIASFLALIQIFRAQAMAGRPAKSAHYAPRVEPGVADRWIDEPS